MHGSRTKTVFPSLGALGYSRMLAVVSVVVIVSLSNLHNFIEYENCQIPCSGSSGACLHMIGVQCDDGWENISVPWMPMNRFEYRQKLNIYCGYLGWNVHSLIKYGRQPECKYNQRKIYKMEREGTKTRERDIEMGKSGQTKFAL